MLTALLELDERVDKMAVCASCQCVRNYPPYDLNLLPSCVTITSSVFGCANCNRTVDPDKVAGVGRSTTIRDIITMLAVAEFVTASSYLVAGINFIALNKGEVNDCDIWENICKIQCFVTTWFSMSGNICTGILVIHFYLILSLGDRRAGVVGKLMPIYYTIAFVCPLTIVMPLLGTGDLKCFSSGVGTMHHPTALSVVTFVIAGPFWVILTFAVITVSYILISVKLVKYGRIHAVHVLQRNLLPLPFLFFILRLWGIVLTIVSIIEGNSNTGGCFPQNTRTWVLVLETLQGIGEGGQGLVLYIFCLPQTLKWFKKQFRRCNGAQRYTHGWRTVTNVATLTDTRFDKTIFRTEELGSASSTYFTFPYEYEDPSEAVAEVIRHPHIHHPHVHFTMDTVPPNTTQARAYTGARTFSGHSSIATSGIPTETSLLSELDVAHCSSETTRNALLSVVYIHMKFADLKMKVLHKFIIMRINLEDFRRFLLSLPVCYRPEHRNPFFDTAMLSSYVTLPDLFDYLDYFWDYINYNLLECVIRKFGDDELKEEMISYCTLFAEVQSVTTLQQLIVLTHNHPDLQIVRPDSVFTELVVRLEANWDIFSLLDAERLRQKFISTYSLAPYSIAFCTAHEGTIVLKLWLRSECAPVIFHCKSQPVIDSRNSLLLQITVDGIPYHFHPSQVINVEVQATPAPDCQGHDISPMSLSDNEPRIHSARIPEVCTNSAEQVDPSSLDTTHLHDLMGETVNVILEWYNLGLALGLLPRTLDAIQSQNADPITCRRTMLIDWLKKKDQVPQNGSPSWRTLVRALRSATVNREDVANDIAQKHKITLIDLT